jgi:hypothetical protein
VTSHQKGRIYCSDDIRRFIFGVTRLVSKCRKDEVGEHAKVGQDPLRKKDATHIRRNAYKKIDDKAGVEKGGRINASCCVT